MLPPSREKKNSCFHEETIIPFFRFLFLLLNLVTFWVFKEKKSLRIVTFLKGTTIIPSFRIQKIFLQLLKYSVFGLKKTGQNLRFSPNNNTHSKNHVFCYCFSPKYHFFSFLLFQQNQIFIWIEFWNGSSEHVRFQFSCKNRP